VKGAWVRRKDSGHEWLQDLREDGRKQNKNKNMCTRVVLVEWHGATPGHHQNAPTSRVAFAETRLGVDEARMVLVWHRPCPMSSPEGPSPSPPGPGGPSMEPAKVAWTARPRTSRGLVTPSGYQYKAIARNGFREERA